MITFVFAALVLAAAVLIWQRVDVAVTAASVIKGTGASVVSGTLAGETITAGQPVYLNAADGKLYRALNDTSAHAQVVGIALHAALAGQPLAYQTSGNLTFNAALTVGIIYVVSANAGGIAPAADLAAGKFVTILGVAVSTTSLALNIWASGVTQ